MNSCDAGAAACDDHAARVPLLPLSFFWTFLINSSANASFLITFLRSNLSVPFRVVPGHSSILTLQRSECACARLLSLIALHPAHPTVAPNSSTFCFVMPCSCKWQWWDGNWIFANFWLVHCPPAVCQPPPHSNHIVTSGLRFRPSDGSEHTRLQFQ